MTTSGKSFDKKTSLQIDVAQRFKLDGLDSSLQLVLLVPTWVPSGYEVNLVLVGWIWELCITTSKTVACQVAKTCKTPLTLVPFILFCYWLLLLLLLLFRIYTVLLWGQSPGRLGACSNQVWVRFYLIYTAIWLFAALAGCGGPLGEILFITIWSVNVMWLHILKVRLT